MTCIGVSVLDLLEKQQGSKQKGMHHWPSVDVLCACVSIQQCCCVQSTKAPRTELLAEFPAALSSSL